MPINTPMKDYRSAQLCHSCPSLHERDMKPASHLWDYNASFTTILSIEKYWIRTISSKPSIRRSQELILQYSLAKLLLSEASRVTAPWGGDVLKVPKLYHVRSVGRQDALAWRSGKELRHWSFHGMRSCTTILNPSGRPFQPTVQKSNEWKEVGVLSLTRRQLEGCASPTLFSSCTHM